MKKLNRPNVLIIYTDQQRLDSLSCYNKHAKTPNLDNLAQQGARLDNYFVNAPVCMPSRMSMLTGRYCSSLGIGQNGYKFPDEEIPVNKIIKQYGYHCAQIGKLHFNAHAKRNHKNPTKTYGFDTFILSDEPGCYDDAYTKWVENIDQTQLKGIRSSLPPAAYHYNQIEYETQPRETHQPYIFKAKDGFHHSDFVASETCEFIKRQSKKNERFFAISGFYAPHTPINPPKRFVDMYNNEEIPLPIMGEENEYMPFLKDLSKKDWKEIIVKYLALVTHLDECVGQIINTLKEENLFDNTLIIFTSDHGEFLGDYGKIQKGMPYDCILNVPCIITYPKEIKEGIIIKELVEAVDIVPTILDFCGIQVPEFIQGKTLKKLLSGEKDTHKEFIFSEHFDHYGMHISLVRTKKYKYVVYSDGTEIFFDLENDPKELHNQINNIKYKNIISDMRLKLILKMQQATFKRYEMEAEY